MNSKITTIAAAVTTIFMFAACGGGGGGGDSDGGGTTGGGTTVTPTPDPTPVIDPRSAEVEDALVEYLTNLADGVIIPAYQNLNAEAQVMNAAAQGFCAQSSASQADLAALQTEWVDTTLAWQAIQWLGVGGIASGIAPIDFRLQFFPDPSDTVTRAVNNFLADPNVVTADFVATQNIAGQGLPALELLLYSDNDAESLLAASDAAKRCEVLQAIAQNVENMTLEVLNSWLPGEGNFREQLVTGTVAFTSTRDAVEEIATNWLESAEIVKDDKLMAALGTVSPGVIDLSEHFRSAQSLNAIVVNIMAMTTLFTNADGMGFDSIITDLLDQGEIANTIQTAIDTAQASAQTLINDFGSLEAAVASEEGRAQVNVVIEDMRVIRDLISIEFIQVLDISIGFNSNDGD